jgi:hypothetical protein
MKAKDALKITKYSGKLYRDKEYLQQIASQIYYQIEREAWRGFFCEKSIYFSSMTEIFPYFDKYKDDILEIIKSDGYIVEEKDAGKDFLGKYWIINWNIKK